jgi:hypothetical protein
VEGLSVPKKIVVQTISGNDGSSAYFREIIFSLTMERVGAKMPVCRKCSENVKGRDGKKAAYLLFLAAVPATYLLGLGLGLFMLGLGSYALVAHNPKRFICEGCSVKSCPECNNELETTNHCKKCKVVVCPFCRQHQPYAKSMSRLATVGVTILLITAFISLMAGLVIAPWVLVLVILFYFYFSSPRCRECNERISTSHY